MNQRPLAGRAVVLCRPTGRANTLVQGLQLLGATVVHLPLIEPMPPRDNGAELRAALASLTATDWLAFTSASAVQFVVEAARSWPPRGPVAAVGPATAAALSEVGVAVAFTAPTATAAALGAAIPVSVGGRVVAPLAERAGPDLADELSKRNISVLTVVAYRLGAPEQPDPSLVRAAVAADVAVFTSPSIVESYIDVVGRPAGVVVSIGPRTSAAARAAGLRCIAEADPHNVDGLIEAVVNTIGS